MAIELDFQTFYKLDKAQGDEELIAELVRALPYNLAQSCYKEGIEMGEVKTDNLLGHPLPKALGFCPYGMIEDMKTHLVQDDGMQTYLNLCAIWLCGVSGTYDYREYKEWSERLWTYSGPQLCFVGGFFLRNLIALLSGTQEDAQKANTIVSKS